MPKSCHLNTPLRVLVLVGLFFFFQVETPIFVCEAAILPLEIWVVFYVKLSNSFIGMK